MEALPTAPGGGSAASERVPRPPAVILRHSCSRLGSACCHLPAVGGGCAPCLLFVSRLVSLPEPQDLLPGTAAVARARRPLETAWSWFTARQRPPWSRGCSSLPEEGAQRVRVSMARVRCHGFYSQTHIHTLNAVCVAAKRGHQPISAPSGARPRSASWLPLSSVTSGSSLASAPVCSFTVTPGKRRGILGGETGRLA